MASAPPIDRAALHDLVLANRILAHEGVLDSFGHVSIRNPHDSQQFVIARSLGPELVTEADLQVFTFAGDNVTGDTRPAYLERAIHAAIYAARPDVQAICHNHSPSIIPFGATGVSLRPVFHMAAVMGGQVPIWDIRDDFGDTDMLVKTKEQGDSLARTLGSGRVALMRGHGGVVVGASPRDVVFKTVYMERNALLQLQATALGNVRFLSDGEIALASQTNSQPVVAERAWTTWERRVATSL